MDTYKIIQTKFKHYRKQMRDIWESYNLVNFYMPLLRDEVKTQNIQPLQLESLVSSKDFKNSGVTDTLGAIDHLVKKANPRRIITTAVGTFEDYLGDLTYLVYLDYPHKLIGGQQEQSASSQSEMNKLLRLIVESTDKNEMLSKIAEEKIRGIFYGNPVDYFIKDKARLEFGNYFTEHHAAEIIEYQEVTARRNVLTHNDGKIDQKYLREVKNSQFNIKQTVPLPQDYIKKTIALLEGLASVATVLVLQNVYKQSPVGPLKKSWESFQRYKSSST